MMNKKMESFSRSKGPLGLRTGQVMWIEYRSITPIYLRS